MRKYLYIMAGTLALSACKNQKEMKEPGYSGENITGVIEIERDNGTRSATARVNKNTDWKLYAGGMVGDIDLFKPVAKGNAEGIFHLDVPKNTRSYFLAETTEGTAILAERHLPMEGGFNFRDMGGYRTNEGRYVKWGMLIRSDEMNNLTDNDLKYLSSIPLASVIDFRSENEMGKAPDRIPASVSNVYPCSISPGNVMESVKSFPNEEQSVGIMEQMNRIFVTDHAVIEQYREFFRIILNEDNLPALYHCTAGKDRTGMATVLILMGLGVDKDTAVKDYLLSNEYLTAKYGAMGKMYPGIKPLLEVRESYLNSSFDAINENYGSVEQYLTSILQVDLDRLKELFLY